METEHNGSAVISESVGVGTKALHRRLFEFP